MILADNGSAWYLSGVPDERWDNNDVLRELGQISGGDLEAVDTSGLMIDPDSGAVSEPIVPDGCGTPMALIQDVAYGTGDLVECYADSEITAGPDVLVGDGASALFSAPDIVLNPGFRVAEGGRFHARSP